MARQITLAEVLKNRDKQFPNEYNKTIEMNLLKTIQAVDEFLSDYTGKIVVTSGRRDSYSNKLAGGAPNSCHLLGLALDLQDKNGDLRKYILKNLEKAQTLGIFFEDFRSTPIWAHCQISPPKSGHRIYIPNTLPFKDPNLWDGVYDHKYDLVTH